MSEFEYILERKQQPENIQEKWAVLLNFLKAQGFEAEVKTQINIKPPKPVSNDKKCKNKAILHKILLRRSSIISQKLRNDFSLGEVGKETEFSGLNCSLSDLANENEDSVDIIKSSRSNF